MAKRFLTLDEVVAEAATLIKGAGAEERLLMKQWAWRALRNIGPTADNVDIVTLYPENLVLRKPDDYSRSISIALYDASGNELLNNYRSGKYRIHQSRNVFVKDGVYRPQFDASISISEDENFYYLGSNGTNVAYAMLRYFKLPVDDQGNPVFGEHVVHAINMWILWYWAIREGKDSREDEDRYKRARAEARSVGKMPNGLLMKQVAKEWNSMIQQYNPDRF
jgi:hypothetical protein